MSEEDLSESRSVLRMRLLKLWINASNHPAEITLQDGSQVKATFRSTDSAQEHIFVSDLQTPIGKVSNGLIRATDIASIYFPLPLEKEDQETS
mmetsp:Transcript_40182/g.55788  ORF Transcript_40182/g.55788 Transcript_40182/m.55788 type:complete len:93 (-) Transcript_40182:185-463(-)